MANTELTKVTFPTSDYIDLNKYRKLTNNDFDSINVTELNAGDLIVTGVGRFTNGLYGNLIGNADTATSAIKTTQDESGNNIKSTYANAISINDHTITLKNKNGTSLGTVTVPDNNTTYTIATGTANGEIKVTPSIGSAYPVKVYGLKSAAYKDVTDTYSETGTDPVSGKAVKSAIDGLPSPMVFRGTVGTGGTITNVPTDGTAVVGDTYKVITNGTYGGKSAKVGDTLICLTKTSTANTWELVPSGDEPSGTVTSVAVTNGGGLSVSGSPITSSGTITISHADTSSQASVNNSGRTYIQDITLDTYGHVTGITSATETVVNTDRYVNSAAFADATSADANNPVKMTLTRAGSDTASVTAYIPKVSSSSAGVAPKGAAVSSQSQTTKFLREDGTWAAPSYSTYTLGTSGNTVTLTPSSGSAQSITVPYATSAGTATDNTKLPLAGGTMTGQIVLASSALKTNESAGWTMNQYGNLVHQRETTTDYWAIANNAGTYKLQVYYETGAVTAAGNVTAPRFIGTADYAASMAEANLTWGGKNFSAGYGCLDAALMDELGANRFQFIKADAITVEYTRDGGTTWTDYGATDAQKKQIFAQGGGLVIGKADSTNKATKHPGLYQLRITIDTGVANVYTVLNKFIIYVTTNGSANCSCKIQKALESTPTTFVDHTDWIPIGGWSGYNVLNVNSFATYGNSPSGQYGRVRFIFKDGTGGNTNYNGLSVSQIKAFGGVGWLTPSTMAKTGHIYSYNENQDAIFSNMVQANYLKATTKMTVSSGKITQLTSGHTMLFADGIGISNPTTANDVGWIRVLGTGESDTIMEIATGDDGGAGEQIVVRQYNTSSTVVNEATLLDKSGNTTFPKNVTATKFIGALQGNADTATSATTAGNVTGTVAIANGGTGATTAANARTALGLGGAAVKGVTDTYSSTGTDLTTGKAIASALRTLNISLTGVPGSSNTLTAFSQINGKVNATFGSISITKSQISDFPTSMTPTSHTHGNIQNGGTLQTNDITIASGDKLVVTDSSDSSKLARTSISFDGSTTTQCLTKKGTWATFGTSNLTIGTTSTTAMAGDTNVNNVTQTECSENGDYNILFSTSPATTTTKTEPAQKAASLVYRPSIRRLINNGIVDHQNVNISDTAIYINTTRDWDGLYIYNWDSPTSTSILQESSLDGSGLWFASPAGSEQCVCWQEKGYGDAFKIIPTFNGVNQNNRLYFQVSTGAAGAAYNYTNKAELWGNGTFMCIDGHIGAKNNSITKNATQGNGGSTYRETDIAAWDSNNSPYCRVAAVCTEGGNCINHIQAINRTTRNSEFNNTLAVQATKAGTCTYSVTNAANFRTAIGAAASSSIKTKKDILDLTEEEALKLLQIRPVSFKYKDGFDIDGKYERNYGVIAEETLEIIPSVVNLPSVPEVEFDESKGLDQELTTVDYAKFVPYLIKLAQMQEKRIEELEKILK